MRRARRRRVVREANTESLENSPPLAYAAQQNNIVGYLNIGVTGTASPQFPLGVTAVPTQAQFPYVQQWHFDIQQEIARSTVATVSYVGSKGTHLTRLTDLNQLRPVPASSNPYQQGETFQGASVDCAANPDGFGVPTTATTPSGAPVTYVNPLVPNGPASGPAVNLAVAEGCSSAGADR